LFQSRSQHSLTEEGLERTEKGSTKSEGEENKGTKPIDPVSFQEEQGWIVVPEIRAQAQEWAAAVFISLSFEKPNQTQTKPNPKQSKAKQSKAKQNQTKPNQTKRTAKKTCSEL